MSGSLFDQGGVRKYLTTEERFAFTRTAYREGGEIATFCLALAFTGARVSELLALTAERVDIANSALVFRTLKRRKLVIHRAVLIPPKLTRMLRDLHNLDAIDCDPKERLWKWGRTTAWKRVKAVMRDANVPERLTMPKAARHAFGIGAVQQSVPINIIQRWMGHARIETTAIYTDVIGKEERDLAQRTWRFLTSAMAGTIQTKN